MRQYIKNIHTRSEKDKKKFALAVSGTFTLIIFAIWLTVKLGNSNSEVVADNQTPGEINLQSDITPVNTVGGGVANAFEGIKSSFGKLKDTLSGNAAVTNGR